MKILFLTDNFYPEVNAPANRTYEHSKEWVKAGHKVTVITCVPNFPKGKVFEGYRNRLIQKEVIDGIEVVRVWSYITANEGMIKRILDYTSFALTGFLASLFYKADVILATSPQFFTAISGSISSFFKRTPWVMEVRDIWPESIVAVGAMEKSRVIRWLEKIEIMLYKSAKKVIVVTDSFKLDLQEKGVNPSKIFVVKNGVQLDSFIPMAKNQELIAKLGLQNKFIIAYFGTHGMAHKLDFILRSAKNVKDSCIQFLIIGDGAEKENLLKLHLELELENVLMLPSVSKSEIRDYLSIIDVALVTLKKSKTFKNVIPSKIFENAAMSKPILLGVEGESKALIESYNAGLCFEPENMDDFLSKIEMIKGTVDLYKVGCQNLANDFDRKVLAQRMVKFLDFENPPL